MNKERTTNEVVVQFLSFNDFSAGRLCNLAWLQRP